MATKYVRTDGNDTTGDGSTTTPWLTINKGITSISAGDTLLVGTGTYAEDTGAAGYLGLVTAFASETTIQSETGSAADVIIKGASSELYNTMLNGGTYMHFKDVTFGTRADAVTYGTLRMRDGANCSFTDCVFTGPASGVVAAINFLMGGTNVQNATFTDCTVTAAHSGLVVETSDGVETTGLSIVGGTYTGTAGSAIRIGMDTVSNTAACTGTISGITATGGNHVILIGAGCTGITVENCRVTGGAYGIVVKQNSGTTIRNNYVYGGTTVVVYAKAAVNPVVTGNTIISTTATVPCFAALYDSADDATCSGVTFTGNTCVSDGTSYMLGWGDSADVAAGGICNHNYYEFRGGGQWGEVNGTALTTKTLASLRAAWATYDVTTNDDNSRLRKRRRDHRRRRVTYAYGTRD